MNVVDASILALLAMADVALMVQLRRTRGRRLRAERVMRSLRLAIRRETLAEGSVLPVKPWTMRRAS